MPTVWIRSDPKHRTRFHRSPSCRQLRKGPARGKTRELLEVDLDEVHVRPCKTCYPDAPRVSIRKIHCPLCDTRYPCPHNGGVMVVDHLGRNIWVWPDANQMPYFRKVLHAS
jgi:hypothetical protein